LPNTKIVSTAVELGSNKTNMSDVLVAIAEASQPHKVPVEYISKLTGVETVYRRFDGQNASDFAAAAGKKALDRAGMKIKDIDLLIFSSASQDLIEPATSHIVSSIMGADGVPVMDIKNACNSFLNALQVSNSFIKSGQYKNILIVSGETPSMAIRWNNTSKMQFLRSFAGFTMSDAGAAAVLTATDNEEGASILGIEFRSDSTKWDVGTLPTGGSRRPRDLDATYFDMDGRKLAQAFMSLGPEILNETLEKHNLTWDDFALIGMHQIADPYIDDICKILEVPADQIIRTVADYGNMTSATMALQLELALEQGRLKTGDLFAYVGLAGGISTGLGIFRI
jgi:3-oxoacyl-[acyl-carrier-protein] synthase-3